MAKEKKTLNYTNNPKDFKDFIKAFMNPDLRKPLEQVLENIFSMRSIGNKTHGDLAEVGITEFIDLFMDGYQCVHVGKEYFRSKDHEEDIAVQKIGSKSYIPISLKAYGVGDLQLSTDKESSLYDFLKEKVGKEFTTRKSTIEKIIKKIKETVMFNVLPLIYKESSEKSDCNVLLFNSDAMMRNLSKIVYVGKGESYDYDEGIVVKQGSKRPRIHPIYLFLDEDDEYICEVRYGDKAANALQRGLWSKTSHGENRYFIQLFENWISYEKNDELLTLIRRALNSSREGQKSAISSLDRDIVRLKNC